MKSFKRRSFLSFAILAILLAQLFGGTVLALEYEAPAEQEIVVEEEMAPQMANGCSQMSTSYAHAQVVAHGFSGIHEFKAAFGYGSEANLYKGSDKIIWIGAKNSQGVIVFESTGYSYT